MGALLRQECWPQPSEKIWPELAQRTHKGLGLEVASILAPGSLSGPTPHWLKVNLYPPLKDREVNTRPS